MKKIITFLLILAMSLSVFTVSAADVITVMVNGEEVVFDVPPMTVNDRTMVPLRAIFEKLGAEVSYDDATRTVTAKKAGTVIKLTIDSNTMYVNEKEITLDVAAFETGGRTLVPVRAISEAFGCQVNWYEEEQLVEIIDANTVVGSVSNTVGKIDIYQYEMDYLLNNGYTTEDAFNTLKEIKAIQLKAQEYGILLDETDIAKINSEIDGYIQQFGSKDIFEQQLAMLGITYEQYIEIAKMSEHSAKFQNKVVEIGAFTEVTDEEAKTYFNEMFLKAKHILISDKTKAYEIVNEIKKGKDFEDYRDLCEDPGSKTNPDGYVFAKVSGLDDTNMEKQYLTYNGYAMVEEFENGAAALKVGQVSQPIQTSYGYHIIKRVALTEEDYEANADFIKALMNNTKYTKTVNEWLNACKVEKYI